MITASQPAASISIANAEHYAWGAGCDGWFLVKNARMTIIQERMPAGSSENLHRHDHARQFFYVLSGVGTMQHGAQTIKLGAGEGTEVAPLVPHKISNQSNCDLVFLVISEPPSHGDRIDGDPILEDRPPEEPAS